VSVYALMPIFNRLAMTIKALECLRAQELEDSLHIFVVDDGSSDGSSTFLEKQNDISVIKGDGTLWWGGAIEVGLQAVLKLAIEGDWVLFVNNDTSFESRFIQNLLDTAISQAPAAVGSVICDENNSDMLISIGATIDTWRLQVSDKLEQVRRRNDDCDQYHEVDALSGRGTLFPVAAFHKAGTMRTRWLPHYLADYELSIRVRKAGFRLLVSERAVVLSLDEFGNSRVANNSLWRRFFSVRSSSYVPAVLSFWRQASNIVERLTFLPRFIFVCLRSWVGKKT